MREEMEITTGKLKMEVESAKNDNEAIQRNYDSVVKMMSEEIVDLNTKNENLKKKRQQN